MILNAIRELGDCSSSEIRRHLHETTSQQIKEQYERGKVSRKKMEFEIEEKTPVMRTIYRGLAILKKEKLIEHNNNKYSISDKARSEVRYWAKEFGKFALSQLMYSYFPQMVNFEENMDMLIEIFGFYTLYCLVEAARPVNDGDPGSNSRNRPTRNDLSLSWTNEVFDHEEMFYAFLGIINNLHDDKTVERTWTEIRIDRDKGFIDKNGKQYLPKLARRLIDNWKISLVDTLYSRSKSNYTDYRSPFELQEDIIEKIMHILEKKYTVYYNIMSHTRAYLFEKRKGKLPDQRDVLDELD